MRLLTSDRLAAFPHGFTTRAGGASPSPWDTLNLGGGIGDEPLLVDENWHRLEAATGLGFARVRQVHGTRVVRVAAATAPAEEADGVVSVARGVAACVSVADCVPVLLADPEGRAVAAIHAGWRGTIELAAAEGVRALGREGAEPGRLVAAIGPSIGPCCYEVSPELAERFRRRFGPEVVRGAPGAPRLDLWRANLLALEEAGVGAERVDVLRRCTACERETFFSHRRDAGRTGRQVGFIAPMAQPFVAHLRRPGEGPLP
jgi:YfiH family protein